MVNLPGRGRDLLKSTVRSVGGRQLEERVRRVRDAWELSQPRHVILLNSHMRSYSSLLSHVLASSGEVCGYTEMRRSYRAEADLLALTWQVRSTNGARLTGPVVLDKLLHNSYVVTDEVLELPNVSILISVREPVAALKSIVAMGIGIDADHHWADPDKACKHYVERLETLASLARRSRKPVVLDPECLLSETDDVLQWLQRSFDLQRPLTSEYPTRTLTGRAEYGDTSDHISSGSIVHDRAKHDQITLTPELVERASEASQLFWTEVGRLGSAVVRPG